MQAGSGCSCRNSLTKVFHKEVMVQSKSEVREFLEPVQVGLSKAGAALLTRCVSGVINSNRDFICFRLDLKNAFNEMSRKAVLDVLANEPSLSHITSFAALILSPQPVLETGGKKWGVTSEGLVQGDPPSGDLFAVGLQPDLVELDRACSRALRDLPCGSRPIPRPVLISDLFQYQYQDMS